MTSYNTTLSRSSLWTRFMLWARRTKLSRNLAFALSIAAIASAIYTYVVITRSENPFGPDPSTVLTLILVDLILLLALVAVVARRAMRLYIALRKGSVGSRLQTRIVAMFSLVTIIPTVFVSVFSALFFSFGIQSWFDEKVSLAIEESVAVAEAYLQEHKETIRSDALSMGQLVDQHLHNSLTNPKVFNQLITAQSDLRGLTEAIVFQRNRILAQTQLSFSLTLEQLSPDTFVRANQGEVVVLLEDEDKVQAVIKLHRLPDTYLIIGRFVDSKVINHMVKAKGGVNEFRRLRENISGFQIQFYIVYVLVALLLLLAATWYGMYFASRINTPIARLIKAAEKVRAGNYDTRVAEGPADDELGTLGRAFNRMTSELDQRREALVKANEQIDERRRFIEAVLGGVSAGVIALNERGEISLHNRSARKLLGMEGEDALKGEAIDRVLPKVGELLAKVREDSGEVYQEEISFEEGDKSRTLLVRITVERYHNVIEGYIVTFDDITELVMAQRAAAWSDVARRVAHEIKNPLTPIKLASERLRKKYVNQITQDKDTYLKYTDTISKHVGEIGRMVDEFVAFARMPAPVIARDELSGLLKKVVFSQQTAHPNIAYDLMLPDEAVPIMGDEQQLSRMLTNLLKNAAEAIESGKSSRDPVVHVTCSREEKFAKIVVRDTGPGFPADMIDHIMEPYVTTREKGTGLGLAIVKKIIEDHSGQLSISNAPEGGALITLHLPLHSDKDAT